MKLLVLTSQSYMGFVFEQVSKLLPTSEFTISVRKNPNFENYEIGISFMYLYKVPKEQVEKHTWINFHPAPLPEYKGRNLCYHAIMNGEKEFGASVHYMDENFDTGDIIWVDWFKILSGDTAEDIYNQTIGMSKVQFKRFLPLILTEKKFPTTKNVGGSYYAKEPIDEFIGLTDYQDRKLRAITYGSFVPKIDSGGVIYKIVKDE